MEWSCETVCIIFENSCWFFVYKWSYIINNPDFPNYRKQVCPSGPRSYVQVVVCSHAWVRVPPLAFFNDFLTFLSILFYLNEHPANRKPHNRWFSNTFEHDDHLFTCQELHSVSYLNYWICMPTKVERDRKKALSRELGDVYHLDSESWRNDGRACTSLNHD